MAADDRFTRDYRETRADLPPGTRNEVITGPVTTSPICVLSVSTCTLLSETVICSVC